MLVGWKPFESCSGMQSELQAHALVRKPLREVSQGWVRPFAHCTSSTTCTNAVADDVLRQAAGRHCVAVEPHSESVVVVSGKL